MKKLVIIFALMGVLWSCSSGSGSSESGNQLGAVTTITYEIMPEKTVYSAGEPYEITATISGPDTSSDGTEIRVSWGVSASSCGFIYPRLTATTATGTAGTPTNSDRDCVMTISARPNVQETVNGVSQIVGTANFVIRVTN